MRWTPPSCSLMARFPSASVSVLEGVNEPCRHLQDGRRVVSVIDPCKPPDTRYVTAVEIEAESASQGGIDRLLCNELAGERELDDLTGLIRIGGRDDAVTV